MSTKPILFSGTMVRALLAGKKTQTRRGLSLARYRGFTEFGPSDTKGYDWHLRDSGMRWHDLRHSELLARLPWHVGDRLYVRESWNWTHIKDLAPGETLGRTVEECCEANGGFACPVGDGIVYAATNAHEHPEFGKARWKPSIHMPRYASRLTLTITEVRVERLQECSEDDAVAEGIEPAPYGNWKCYGATPKPFRGAAPTVLSHGRGVVCADPVHSYATLWDNINGPGAWDASPWAAAYTFTVDRSHVDQVGA